MCEMSRTSDAVLGDLPLVTLEEHCMTGGASTPAAKKAYEAMPDQMRERLFEVGQVRISSMDANNIALQVISHAPTIQTSPWTCKCGNDELAKSMRKYPGRFAGFATLSMNTPDEAAKELERCVKDLGFVGALIGGHTDDGKHYDGERFWPVWEKAECLDVPIYIHPTFASPALMDTLYSGNYDEGFAMTLSAFAWGWHQDIGLHFLKLLGAGVFDRFPKLKIILGHDGEMLPFMLDRIEKKLSGRLDLTGKPGNTKRSIRTVWNENIWVTTAGMFTLPPLELLLKHSGPERIMFSVDFPFENNEDGLEFLRNLKRSGIVSLEAFEGIAFRNAEKLLHLSAH